MSIQTFHIHPSVVYSNWMDLPDSEVNHFFQKIQKVYEDSLAAGYTVSFASKPRDGVVIKAIGKRSKSEKLIQKVQQSCSFCLIDCEKKLKEKSNFFVLKSLNNQVLLIPNRHYDHWFETPLKIQKALFKEALEMRESSASHIQSDMELHCGSIGGQSVPHLHFRSGIYLV